MKRTIISFENFSIRAVAWLLGAFCLWTAIIGLVTVTLTAGRQFAALDPIPAPRWEDVR